MQINIVITVTVGRAQREALRGEVFERVEREFMLGLNARDPAMRARFLELYNNAVQGTLFDRLKFIVNGQDWKQQAHSFWLKQGLVRPTVPATSPSGVNC